MHLIAHSTDVQQNLIRALVNELAAERANHVQRLSVSAARVSTQRRLTSTQDSRNRCRRIVRVYTEIRMRWHFYSVNKNQIGPTNKSVNSTPNCFPRGHARV